MGQDHPSLGLAPIGALSFGAGAFLACALSAATPPLAPLLALPLAGAVGGGGLARSAVGRRAAPLAALRFALSGFLILFSLISLQAEVEPAWGATAWGLGLALGGGIGGGCLRRAPTPGPVRFASPGLAGALAFGLSGAVGGGLEFALFRALSVWGLAMGMVLALALGGALLGLTVGPAGGPRPSGPGHVR
jgi:hypothetical protein